MPEEKTGDDGSGLPPTKEETLDKLNAVFKFPIKKMVEPEKLKLGEKKEMDIEEELAVV